MEMPEQTKLAARFFLFAFLIDFTKVFPTTSTAAAATAAASAAATTTSKILTTQMPLGVGKRRRVCNKLSEECNLHECECECVRLRVYES